MRIELHVLACGHGDTILLRLPGDRWALIDCFLPDGEVRERFFEFVRTHGIDRLEWVIQTHPDRDHFYGMIEVLDHFTREGRSVGHWCDGGVNAKHVPAPLRGKKVGRDYFVKLHHRLNELDDAGRIGFVELNDQVKPLLLKGHPGFAIYPVAPTAARKRRTHLANLGKLAANPTAQLESNSVSVVAVVEAKVAEHECTILLSGDAPADELKGALEAWAGRDGEPAKLPVFDVVKVPHHGSIDSHSADLVAAKRHTRTQAVAAISCGTRRVLPDGEVLREYLDAGWVVLVTTRTGRSTPGRPMSLADRGSRAMKQPKSHNLVISWDSSGNQLSWRPPEAQVRQDDLTQYASAKS